MSRLFTAGREVGVSAVESGPDGLSSGPGTVTLDTSIKRSGAASWKYDSGSGSVAQCIWGLTIARSSGLSIFIREYQYYATLPNTTAQVLEFYSGASTRVSVRLTSAGKLQLWDNAAGVQIGSNSTATIAINTWYRIELKLTCNSTPAWESFELLLDGVSVASGNVATPLTVSAQVRSGWGTALSASKVMYSDDAAINDSNGSVNNSWPGDSKVVLMKPTSDSQVGSWTGGAGGTSNLYTAVDNTPPIGTDTETDSTQIESVDTSGDNSTDEYRANCGTYTAAGIGTNDIINAISTFCNHGEDDPVGTKTGSMGAQSNPSETYGTFTFGTGSGVAAWPTGWRWQKNAVIDAPTVTKGSSLIIAVRKTDSGSAVASVDFIGAYVDYTISTATPISDSDSGSGSEASSSSAQDSKSDTGSGADASTSAAQNSVSDSFTDTENVVLAAANTVTDTGSGSDTGSVDTHATLVSGTDTGAGADANSLSASLTDSDAAGTTTDDGSVIVAPILNGTDSGSGTDEISQFTRNLTDSGSGAEAQVVSFLLTDSGASTDVISTLVRELSESGAGVDALSLGIPVSDSGTDVESGIITRLVSPTGETGSGTEALTLSTATTISDTGAGADTAPAPVASITGTDTGSGADAMALARATTDSDFGGGGDASSLRTSIPVAEAISSSEVLDLRRVISETGTGSETPIISLIAADASIGADVLSSNRVLSDSGGATEIPIPGPVSSESGTGLEILTALTREVAEHGSSADSASVGIGDTRLGTDEGVGQDTGLLQFAVTVSDAGAGVEVASVASPVSGSDSGTGTEISRVGIPVSDTASGAETVNLSRLVTDIGSSSEQQTVSTLNSRQDSDSGSGSETYILSKEVFLVESGTATENVSVNASFSLLESGTATENASIANNVIQVSDVGTGSDQGNQTLYFSVSDSGTATDDGTSNVVSPTDFSHSRLLSVNGRESTVVAISDPIHAGV